MKKRILSIILSLCMLLSVMPLTGISVDAATGTALSGSLGSQTLTSGSYYLSGNAMGNITVESGSTVTLDLNGHVLKGTGSGAVITNNGGTLTVTDSSVAKTKHYFTEGSNMLWNWNDDSATTDFYVEGGTITGGNETANGGGGVCSINGTTTISNVNIIGNQTSKWGGGVRGKGSGSIVLTDTNVIHNFATSSSGGISLDGTPLTINGGCVSYNKSADGGGIYPYYAKSFSATNCLIKGNVSTGKGGGVYVAGCNTTFTGCEFDGNSASSYAGAVRLDGSYTATFDGCNFHDNTSGSQGGAIKSDNATVILTNSTVKNNTANGTGGGMQIWNGSLTLNGTTVTDNTATDNGGGVYANCNVTLSGNTVVTGNKNNGTLNNLYLNTGKLITLTNQGSGMNVGVKLASTTGKFTSNGTSDDVKYFTSDIITSAPKYNTNGYLEIVNINVCYVSDSTSEANNYATISAALEQSPDKIVLKKNVTENVTISSGTTVALDLNGYVLKGTGTPLTNNGTLTLTSSDTTTLRYFTYVNHGKWVYIPEPTTAQINGAIPFSDMDGKELVSNSTVISIPGGIVTGGTSRGIVNTGSSATLNMSDVSIVGNEHQWGGGLDNQSGAKAYITDVNVIGNIATKWGGAGVNNDSSTLSYEGGCIAYNSLTGCGDNIKCSGMQTNCNATLTNVKVIHNYSVKNGGGVGTIGNTPVLTLNGCTVTNNEAVQYGGGVYIGYGSLSVSGNTVVTGNTGSSVTQNVYLASGKQITIGSSGLGSNAEIGVYLASGAGKFTSNGEASDKQYFTSDNSSYAVKYNTSGYFDLVSGYTVTEAICTHGSVSVGTEKVYQAGEKVTVTATPSSKNYVIDKVYYGETEITPVEGVYSFTMPESNVTVSATFKLANIAYNDFDSMAIGELPIGWDISGSDCQYEKYPGDMWQVYKDTNNRIALRVRNYSFSSGTYADINTPTLTLSSTNAEKLVFNYAHQSNSKPLEVWISDDGGVNFTKLAGFGYNSVSGYNDTTATKLSNAIVNLTDYKGKSVIIKLRMVSTYGEGSIFVDDFDIVPITEDDKKLLSVTTPSVANAVYSLSYTTANALIATFPTSTAVTTGDGVSSMPVVWALKDGTTYTTADSEVNTFTWSLVYDGYDANGQTVTGEIAVKNVAYNDFDSMQLKKTPLGWSTAASNPANPSAENCWGVYQNGDRIMLRMNNFMLRKGTAIIDTPAITLEDGIRYLTFKYCHQANNGSFEVQISDDGGETFTKLAEYSNPFTYYDNTNPASLTRTTIDLVDYLEKTVIIRLYTTSNFGKGAIFIDDFDIVPSVAKIKETGVLYTSVQSAIDAATQGQTVMLIHDAAESITVNSDDDIILDLNGYVLRSSGTESVINNNGVLSVKNTNLTSAIRYFTDQKCKHSVKVGTYCEDCEANAKPDGCYETMSTEKPASGTDYITVSGGVITGGCGGTYVSSRGYCGGGIYNAGTLTLTNVNIVGNRTSGSGSGGGIFNNGASLEMNGGVISGNASASSGGGIYIHSGVNSIKGVDISENTSSDIGGGICNTAGDSSITIEDCSICDNTATGDYGEGGGIRFNGGSLLVKNTEIKGNSAGFSGGALINAGTVTFDGVTVTANTSSRDGGCFHSSGAITLEGKINITGNTSNGTVCNYDGNEKEIIIGSTFDTASTIGVYCYDIPFTVTSACAKDVHECFSSDIDAYMTVDRGIEGTDNHEVVVTGRITKHPTIDNNYTLTVNTDRLTNNTVKYQWKMRTSMKWSGLTENEDFEMVCGSVSGDSIKSGDFESQAVVIKFIGLPVGTKVVFSSDAEVYKTQRSDGKYEGELDEDGYIWIWGKDYTKTFTIKIEEIPFYEVVAGETAAQLAKPKLSETYICTATFADGSVLASNEVIVPVCRITQSTDTALEGKYYTSIAEAITAAGTNATTIRMIANDTENITIEEGQTITLDLNGYVLYSDNINYPYECLITNAGYLTITDSDVNAAVHKVHYFTDEKCDSDVPVGEPCQHCEGGVAVKDGMYETYTDEAPQDMTGVRTVYGGCIAGNEFRQAICNVIGAVLIFNGGSIIGNNAGINNIGDCTINGGSIIANRNVAIISNGTNSTVTINDCLIAENYAVEAITNACGTVIMNGGTITGNHCENAGGIYSEEGTVKLYGGTISGNVAELIGGVVSIGACVLGGSVKIYGNEGGMANNLCLLAPAEIGTGDYAPTDEMYIGVTLIDIGTYEQTGGKFTTNGASTDTKYFFSDNKDYGVKYNNSDGGYLELANTPEDVKNATYSASLTLGKNIDVNFKMGNIASADKDKLSITVDGTPVSFELKDGVAISVLKAVVPNEIGKAIHVVVKYDGVTVKDFNYSVKTYCDAAFKLYENDNAKYESLKTLCEAILNYGKWAEDYANGNDNSTVNAGHEIDFSKVDLPKSQKKSTPNTTYGNAESAAYLELRSTIRLNYLVKTNDFAYELVLVKDMENAEAIKQGKFKTGDTPYKQNFFIINGEERQIDPAKISVSSADGGYLISVDLYAYQLANKYTLKVKGVDLDVFEITLGVYDYCSEVQDMSGTAYTNTLKTLCKAIYNYGEAVKAYANAQ